MSTLLLDPHSTLLMIGDSITDCGRARPLGEGPDGQLGNGYVSLVDAILRATYPAAGLRLLNMGISGNTVRDLNARWERDVQALQPDWLAILIGINDGATLASPPSRASTSPSTSTAVCAPSGSAARAPRSRAWCC